MARTQLEITAPEPLLNAAGNIAHPGFAKALLWCYDRSAITAPAWRIKEWDYYYVGDQTFGLALTIADVGYVSNVAASLLSFEQEHATPWQTNDAELGILPLGKLGMPATSVSGDIGAHVGRANFTFTNDGQTRHLTGTFAKYAGKDDLTFDITLTQIPAESIVVATPFDKDKHFYYNQKINCMRAEGWVTWGNLTHHFDPQNQAMATLDWGRGVWTYDNTWYWGSGQMELADGRAFGFNIGYGFGDTSAASENALFLDGQTHKLEDVTFEIPRDATGAFDYMAPWEFHSSDGRFEMRFEPIIDRQAPVDFKVIMMIPHQVFGRMYGTAILDSGEKITLDGQICFAEHVHNKW